MRGRKATAVDGPRLICGDLRSAGYGFHSDCMCYYAVMCSALPLYIMFKMCKFYSSSLNYSCQSGAGGGLSYGLFDLLDA